MPTAPIKNPQVIRGGFKTQLPEASGQTFKAGEFFYCASGQVTVCASLATTMKGQVLQDATGTENALVDVLIFDQSTVLRGNVYHATAASAITATGNTDIKYSMYKSSNKWYVNIGDTSNDSVVILSIDQGEVGYTYGNVNFRFLSAVLQGDDVAT